MFSSHFLISVLRDFVPLSPVLGLPFEILLLWKNGSFYLQCLRHSGTKTVSSISLSSRRFFRDKNRLAERDKVTFIFKNFKFYEMKREMLLKETWGITTWGYQIHVWPTVPGSFMPCTPCLSRFTLDTLILTSEFCLSFSIRIYSILIFSPSQSVTTCFILNP